MKEVPPDPPQELLGKRILGVAFAHPKVFLYPHGDPCPIHTMRKNIAWQCFFAWYEWGRGPHGGIERLSGVQMLPPKSFYLKVLGGWGREKSYLIWEFATQSVQTQCATR